MGSGSNRGDEFMELAIVIMFVCIIVLVGAAYDAHKDLQEIKFNLDLAMRALNRLRVLVPPSEPTWEELGVKPPEAPRGFFNGLFKPSRS